MKKIRKLQHFTRHIHTCNNKTNTMCPYVNTTSFK